MNHLTTSNAAPLNGHPGTISEQDHEHLRFLQSRADRSDENFAELCRFVRYLDRKGV